VIDVSFLMSSASAITHPDPARAGLANPLFRYAGKRVGEEFRKVLNSLFPPQAKRGWTSEAMSG